MTAMLAVIGDCSPSNADAAKRAANQLDHHGDRAQAVYLPGLLAVETREKSNSTATLSLIHDEQRRRVVILDGRIDRLDADPHAMSDPSRLAQLVQDSGPSLLSKAYGSFVFAMVDYAEDSVFIARDALGNRSVFYAFHQGKLIFATEEQALLQFGVSSQINEQRVRNFLAIDQPIEGSTFFKQVSELPAGSCLSWRRTGSEVQRYYHPARDNSTFRMDPDNAASQLHKLLEQAVQRQRSLADGPVAVSMSGGLDSSTLAVLAHKHKPVVAISYQFPTIAECDETPWVEAICQRSNIQSIKINADHFQPLSEGDLEDINRNTPERSIYHQLRKGVADVAKAKGLSSLTSGDFGDHLYLNWPNWIRDAVRRGEVGFAAKEWVRCWQQKRHRLTALTGRRKPRLTAPWLLTPLPNNAYSKLHPALGPRAARDASAFRNSFLNYGIDHKLPFRDRELAEFMVSLPAHYLFRNNCYKWLTRKAFDGDLPASVLQRKTATRVTAYLHRAVYQRDPKLLRQQLQRYAAWREYVSPNFVNGWLSEQTTSNGFLVLWRALCFSRWVDRHY